MYKTGRKNGKARKYEIAGVVGRVGRLRSLGMLGKAEKGR